MPAVGNLIAHGGYRIGRKFLPLFPRWPGEVALVKLLNRQLSEELDEGVFDFLDGRVLEIAVTDLKVHFRIGKRGGRFVRASAAAEADSTIAATAGDFLAIAAGREDPDTLFFHRRLMIRGQTEIGLTVKNRLDALDRSRIPGWLQRCLTVMADKLASLSQA
ncbi:Predicted lipid carrier protein YhbT, contains SCP2 domain [Microbulbifer thermotolerans]|uniref:ubiquinone anaerobic biosynthesis accessory factor UbiT n=1 Tax=Microbulbifer thermotolerans TaxID=252514 RepID=UPI0008E29623|nr:SCP2 sterol-binding domain-containing protein [Microbulbifer thermotolerans]SFC89021.1 Predicted lipid carrier protein YhbT, contains SCP2 domain [Microbulbifer thermotolerans]